MKLSLNFSYLCLPYLVMESDAKYIETGGICSNDVYKGICKTTDCCGYAIPVYGGLAERRCNTQGATTLKTSTERYTFICKPFADKKKKAAGSGSTYLITSYIATGLATSYFLS